MVPISSEQLRARLKECDLHLTAYLQSVPRRGFDLVVHISGESIEDVDQVLDELRDRIRQAWPIQIVSSRGWWADGVQLPWHRWVQNNSGELVAEPAPVTELGRPPLENHEAFAAELKAAVSPQVPDAEPRPA